jgi:tRNA uridine 5-carboxymethylaminomethyl modification enzyme
VLESAQVQIAELPAALVEKLDGDASTISGQSFAQLLKRPEVEISELASILLARLKSAGAIFAEWAAAMHSAERLPAWVRNEMKSVETEIKYAGYLDKQRRSIEKMKKAEDRRIPEWFDYRVVSGLSREMQQTLERVRPMTLGQASRIAGVTPAAVTLVNIYIEIQGKGRQAIQRQTA